MLRKLKIPIIVVVTVLLNQAAGYAVHAAVPEAFLPAGTTRYAAIAGGGTPASTSSTSWSNLPGLAASISIPTGKTGDVMVLFCGEAASSSYMDVRAVIGSEIAPGEVILREKSASGAAQNQCANFVRLAVPAGGKLVRMQWRADPGLPPATQQIWARSMIVVVNLH